MFGMKSTVAVLLDSSDCITAMRIRLLEWNFYMLEVCAVVFIDT